MNKSGIFVTNDALNNPITLKWEEVKGQTNELTEKIKSISHVLVPAYAQIEVDFAQKKPQDVPNDFMLKSLAHLLDDEVDWKLFEEETIEHLEQFFQTFDWTNSSKKEDSYIFVTAQDQKTNTTLGVIQFVFSPEFAKDNIKAALYGVLPSAQNRGLEKILMGSIFKLHPQIERIFLHTRSTNQHAIESYQNWGFAQFEGTLPNWTDLEYLADSSDILQNTAAHLTPQSE